MRHVTVNFVRFDQPGRGATAFRRATCVVENAIRLGRRGLARDARLEIVLVGDAAALPPAILELLDTPPCRLHRPQAEYDGLATRYRSVVDAVGGPYSTFGFAFLRWLLVERLFPGEPVLCYDGDILHMVQLGDLGRAFAGLTTTATSTCFAAISDPGWFRTWERALDTLDADPRAFARDHPSPVASAGFLPNWSPEEFLAKVLIEDGSLRQDPLPDDFPYWIIPQPHLLPRLYSFVRTRGSPARVPTPMRYERVGGVDLIAGRPVAFWHLQKPFLFQLGTLIGLERLPASSHPGRVPPLNLYGAVSDQKRARAMDPYHDEDGIPPLDPALLPLAHELVAAEERLWTDGTPPSRNPFSPASVCRRYFDRGDLSPLFDEAIWPVPGMWA
ncbi:MAG: hypothetical protein AB7P02_26720 [Alphaproteobacteria bacterium]